MVNVLIKMNPNYYSTEEKNVAIIVKVAIHLEIYSLRSSCFNGVLQATRHYPDLNLKIAGFTFLLLLNNILTRVY